MGPVLLVIPAALSQDDIEWIHGWLSNKVYSLTRTLDSWKFWTDRDTCHASLAVVPFGAESCGDGGVSESHLEEPEIANYAALLGFRPLVWLQFDNFCRSDKIGHKQMAGLIVDLLRKFGGFVSVGRAIDPLIAEREAKKRKKPKPGRWLAYTHPSGLIDYLIDADLLEEWIRHPAFYLEI